MNNWQKIETAPKDGTRIIAFEPVGSWQGKRWGEWRIAITYWHQPGNPENLGYWCSSTADKYRPTHWMPLPKPPLDKSNG